MEYVASGRATPWYGLGRGERLSDIGLLLEIMEKEYSIPKIPIYLFMACVRASLLLNGLRLRSRGGSGARSLLGGGPLRSSRRQWSSLSL